MNNLKQKMKQFNRASLQKEMSWLISYWKLNKKKNEKNVKGWDTQNLFISGVKLNTNSSDELKRSTAKMLDKELKLKVEINESWKIGQKNMQ